MMCWCIYEYKEVQKVLSVLFEHWESSIEEWMLCHSLKEIFCSIKMLWWYNIVSVCMLCYITLCDIVTLSCKQLFNNID